MSGVRNERERTVRAGLARICAEMLAGHDDNVLAKIEIERRLVVEATRDFNRAVADARGGGFAWEQIAEHVPGLVDAHGACAAEKRYQLVSVDGSRHGERYVSWRCRDCEGLVLDHGPYGGNPVNIESGHREGCERLRAEVSAHIRGLEAYDQPTEASSPIDAVDGSASRPGPIAGGPCLEL